MKFKLFSSLLFLATSLTLFSFNALAAYSAYVGGNGGTNSISKTCPSEKRMTGFKVKHGSVIDKIRIRCTTLNKSNGNWVARSHSWMSYTRADAPIAARSVKSAYCPTNKWVYSVSATLQNNSIQKLAVQCLPRNANGQLAGTSVVKSAGANTTGQWSSWKACPQNGMANGISGKSGWHLDKLRLRCTNQQQNIASSGTTNNNTSSSQPGSPTLGKPQLIFPRWAGNNDSYAMSGNWQFTTSKVAGASKYEICLRDENASNCFSRQQIAGRASGNRVNLSYAIPSTKQGKIITWQARACNNSNQCGSWSNLEKFTVVPNAATLSSPTNNATQNSRSLQLRWNRNDTASAGYQVYVYKRGTRPYDWYQPTKQSNNDFYNYRINSGTSTGVNLRIPPSLGNNLSWIVVSCGNYTGKGRRCSLGGRAQNITIASTSTTTSSNSNARFSQLLKSTFQSARCVQCHGGKDLANHNPNSVCKSCHTHSDTYKSGGLNVDWHAAPTSMTFVNKSSAYLCNKAKQPPASASTSACGSSDPAERVRCHLTMDPLVLWAVDSGRLPNGINQTKATPGNKNIWKQRVNQWIDGGMNCN